MITPSERIHDLVQKGALPPEQGETLLAAISKEPPRWSRLLLDPLERFGGERLVLVGLGAVLVGAVLGRFGVAFDGFLDTHLAGPQSWQHVVAQAVVAWPLGALVLWVASLLSGRQGRYIDFLGVVGVARVPHAACGVLLASIAQNPRQVVTPDHSPELSIRLLAVIVVATLGLIWCVTLLYRGFGTASGLRGARRVVTFVMAVLVAELTSKPILLALSQALLRL